MEQMTGQKLTNCPWRGYRDPVVAQVLQAKSMIGDGPIAALPMDTTPNRVVEGLLAFRRATHAIHNDDAEKRRKEASKR